jgi:hypothetical protein
VKRLRAVNVALRGLMETGVVVGLGYWGFHAGGSRVGRVGLMVAAPLVGFGFWSLVDFRGAGRAAEPLRLLQELAVSGVASVACYTAGAHVLGWALAIASLVHHALVYATGETLLKP